MKEEYRILSNLWASGSRDYLILTSSYLTANSILVATITLMFRLDKVAAYAVALAFSICGIIICIQMGIAMGRLRAQNGYFERSLRIIENNGEWSGQQIFRRLYDFREDQQTLPREGDERCYRPNFSIKHHRACWAPRMKILPFIFLSLYSLLLIWSLRLLAIRLYFLLVLAS